MNTFSCAATQPPRILFVHSLMGEMLRVFYFNLSILFLINLSATAFERTIYDLFRVFMLPSLPQYLSISSSSPTTSQCAYKCHYPHFTEEKLEGRVTKAIGTRVLGDRPTKGQVESCHLPWFVLCFPFLRLSGWQCSGLGCWDPGCLLKPLLAGCLRVPSASTTCVFRAPSGRRLHPVSLLKPSRWWLWELVTAKPCICVYVHLCEGLLQRVKCSQSFSCVASLEGCFTPLTEAILHLPKHDRDFLQLYHKNFEKNHIVRALLAE